MTEVLQMPGGLARRFGAWSASLAWAGVSTASVWRLDDRSGRALFLKLVADDRRVRLSDERRRMLWAAGRIAVPRPVDYGWENQVEWLLTEGLAGQDLWAIRNTVDVDAAVRAFATGLRELHALDVDDCPFDARLNVLVPQLLDEASRTYPETKLLKPRGWTVARAAAHIEARRPGHEDLVVSHGDVCMPNILIRDGRVSGFVDVGSLASAIAGETLRLRRGRSATCGASSGCRSFSMRTAPRSIGSWRPITRSSTNWTEAKHTRGAGTDIALKVSTAPQVLRSGEPPIGSCDDDLRRAARGDRGHADVRQHATAAAARACGPSPALARRRVRSSLLRAHHPSAAADVRGLRRSAVDVPSTTTAHVTTLHTGLPVGLHGLYEWNVYEPALGEVITPLMFSLASEDRAETLSIDPAIMFPPGPTLYERLAAHCVPAFATRGVPPFATEPWRPSAYDSVSLRGAEQRPYKVLTDGVAQAVQWLMSRERGFAYLYTGEIDRIGHKYGPSSDRFKSTIQKTLDQITAGLAGARDVVVLMTADHGQVDVNPFGTIWLDELYPPLADMRLHPAGSARDVFLHVDDPDAVIDALSPHIEVHRTAALIAEGMFGEVGPRFLERVGNVCVLPPANRMAWLKSARQEVGYRGHHGGRTDEDTATYIAALQL